MIRTQTLDRIAYRFDSLSDVLSFVETPAAWSGEAAEYGRHACGLDMGTDTLAQAVALARFGWKEGRDKLSTGMASAAMFKPPAPIATCAYDVAGAFPDVGLYCAGDPACMVSYDPEQAKTRPVLRFVVNLSYLAGVSGEAITNRGAAILSYVDKLESEGMRVELVAVRAARGKGKVFNFTFPLKAADEPLDIDRVAFVIANPAMLRRIGFAVAERDATAYRWFGNHGYGSCDDFPADWSVPHSVYFPALKDDGPFYSAHAAMSAVQDTIRDALPEC